ncbi:hypothetical protein FRB94_008098 [Tulasnella sp. JGI-2019a]|nr:hypothetical protein FRB94_008098 [Tulasnella sp. JGI-2019a]KAG9017350.1 hypothetical protein FRB93_007464 [Tulasnella sp. JGI-2019a]KAG9034085.1 hypothetical protein FRB95_013854 [Tulasnella sp. JGI-2019a]
MSLQGAHDGGSHNPDDQLVRSDPSTHKRKRGASEEGLGEWTGLDLGSEGDEEDWGNGEAPKLGSQVLPVAALPDDYDGEPVDGLEYLFFVRRDASTRPGVTRVDNPYEVECSIPVTQPVHAKAHPAIPTDEWKKRFEQRFINLRLALIQKMQDPRSKDLVPIPKYKDRDGWWKFINGGLKPGTPALQPALDIQETGQPPINAILTIKTTVGKTIPGAPHDESEESEDDGSGSEAEDAQCDSVFVQKTGIINDMPPSPPASAAGSVALPGIPAPPLSNPVVTNVLIISPEYHPTSPSTEIITQLDNKAAFHLLMFFTFWINMRLDRLRADENHHYNPLALCDNDAKWIFCLLARLDEILAGEQISTLRDLARACLSLLLESLKGANGEILKTAVERQTGRDSCWMVIVAVAKGWGQRDLWEDAIQAVNALCS